MNRHETTSHPSASPRVAGVGRPRATGSSNSHARVLALLPRLACLVAVWASTITAANADCLSAWVWENPLPTGNGLRGVSFLDENTGVAVGEAGTVLWTGDGGESWTTIRCGAENTELDHVRLTGTAYIDADNIVAVGTVPAIGVAEEIALITRTTDGGRTWSSPFVEPNFVLSSVRFSGATTGIAVGVDNITASPLILRTVDGGTTWNRQMVDVPTAALGGVAFANATTAVAVGVDLVSGLPLILRSTDSGITWTRQVSSVPAWLSSVYFTDADTGWAVGIDLQGGSGAILKTSDGGISWTDQASGVSVWLLDVAFSDDETGVVVGRNSTILKTMDGGASWIRNEAVTTGTDLLAVSLLGETGTVVGAKDNIGSGGNGPRVAILTTGDGGDTWANRTASAIPNSQGGLRDVIFLDEVTGVAVGSSGVDPESSDKGTIVKTVDGGRTWTVKHDDLVAPVEGVSFGDTNNAIAVGGRGSVFEEPTPAGLILATTDGGESWAPQVALEDLDEPFDAAAFYDVSCSDPENCTAVGTGIRVIEPPVVDRYWLIVRTTDGGNSWSTQVNENGEGGLARYLGVEFVDSSHGIAVGSDGRIVRTTDGGATWNTQETGTEEGLHDVVFIDPDTAIAVGGTFANAGTILRTEDGGTTWTTLETGLPVNLYSVSFQDQMNGIAVGYNSNQMIWRTTDGGESWFAEPSGAARYRNLYGVAMTGADTAVAVGERAVILRRVGAVALSPDTLDFGPVLIGQARGPLNEVLANVDSVPVTVTEVTGPDALFTVGDGTCGSVPFTLGPAESCELSVTFSPTTAGVASGSVTVVSDAPSSPHVFDVQGIGAEHSLHIEPGVLDFGEVVTGENSELLGTVLTNTDVNAAAIEVDSVDLPETPFAASGGTCGETPFVLEPFASCTLTYTFSPTEAGGFTTFVDVTSDAPSSLGGFALQGDGLLRELTVTPDALDFGDVTAGETGGPLSVSLTNTGEVDVALSDVSNPAPPFDSVGETCEAVLAPGASCQLDYTFTPFEPGEASAEVAVSSNAPSSPDAVVLQGMGLAAAITVDPESLGFTVGEGESDTADLEISNYGNIVLTWSIDTAEPAGSAIRTWRTTRQAADTPVTDSFSNGAGSGSVANGTPVLLGDLQMSQTSDTNIAPANSAACPTGPNYLMRRFYFDEHPGVGNPAGISSVDLAIQEAVMSQTLTVNLYTLPSGTAVDTIPVGSLTEIGSGSVTISGADDGTIVNVPVTATVSDTEAFDLVVEVSVEEVVYIGATNTGETHPGFIMAPACGSTAPTRIDSLGPDFEDTHIILVVNAVGEPSVCESPSMIPWLSIAPASGSTEAGESELVSVGVDATGLEPGDHEAILCVDSNDPQRRRMEVPVTLTVPPPPAPELAFTPASLVFGDVDVDATSEPQLATLQNTGAVAATSLSFTAPDSDFVIDSGDCGDSLPSGGSCEVVVVFSPTEPGPAAVSLQASSGEGAGASLELTGNGVGHAAFVPTALVVDPEEVLSDGNGVFEPGEMVDVAPSWRNDGTAAVSVSGTASAFEGPEGAVYTLEQAATDYGLLEPGAEGSCLDVGVCYGLGVNAPAARPATHWEAEFTETLSDSEETTHLWTLHIGESFSDVRPASPFYRSIETLLHSGVTGGCDDTSYCPKGSNTRSQMAVFLLRAVEGSDFQPEACEEGSERFDDVPASNMLCPWIQELAAREVTSGCGDGNYCPGDSVTRGQMAVFLLKALEGTGYTPPACTGEFSDVDCESPFAPWIEELAGREITAGCSATEYCPAASVTRAQMAAFIGKAFGLTLYGP